MDGFSSQMFGKKNVNQNIWNAQNLKNKLTIPIKNLKHWAILIYKYIKNNSSINGKKNFIFGY